MGVEIANNHVPFYNFDEMLSYDFWCQLPHENEPMKENVRYVKRLLTLQRSVTFFQILSYSAILRNKLNISSLTYFLCYLRNCNRKAESQTNVKSTLKSNLK